MTVAVLGTGIMGTAMARTMARTGLDVRAWNRHADRATPLAADGVTVCASAAEAVAGADVVVTLLFDAGSVREVMTPVAPEVSGAWLQMSTVGMAGTEDLAGLAAEHGIAFLDAPVVGTKGPAEQGSLVVLVAGDRETEPTVAPVLDAVGSRTVWVSDQPGAATALKLVVNSWVGSLNAAVGQAVALATALGLDPQLFLDAIRGGPTDTTYAHLKGGLMIGREYPTAFALDNARKDLGLIRDAAADAQVDTTLVEALLEVYARSSERGHGDEDMASVHEGFRR